MSNFPRQTTRRLDAMWRQIELHCAIKKKERKKCEKTKIVLSGSRSYSSAAKRTAKQRVSKKFFKKFFEAERRLLSELHRTRLVTLLLL